MSTMRSSFRDSSATTTDGAADRRTVIVERLNGSFGFTLQSYGIHYREESDVEIVTYVDFVDPNGHAYKAGLRSGDVILSINGQDVDRADHTTLVSIIQSCPDRIRMVVIYENCVRKVELHMKYIRLTQALEAKARDYQEVCAKERNFIARLNKTQGAGPYYTMHHPSQVVMRREQAPSSTTPGSYSSKSLPRPLSQAESFHESSAINGSSTSPTGNCGSAKRRSYLCIGRGSDCDCCFRPEGVRMSSPGSDCHRPKQQQQQQQRPRSVHLSCYKDPNASSSEERYLIRPSERNSCKVYGGYGFGYEFSVAKNHHPHNAAYTNPNADVQCYGRCAAPPVPAHKSAEDLTLVAQFQNQCRLTNSPHRQPQQQYQDVARAINRPHYSPQQLQQHQLQQLQLQQLQQQQLQRQQQQQQSQAQTSDSIAFYTRPPQPATQTTVRAMTSGPGPARHQQPHYRPFYQPAQSQLDSQGNDDEGGFNEARRFRTLPAATTKRVADNR